MATFLDDAEKVKNKYIVEIRRGAISDDFLRGIILSCSHDTVLLSCLDDNFYWNGFALIRTGDVSWYRIFDQPDDFIFKVQRELGLHPQCPSALDCHDIKTLCHGIHSHFPLITVYQEKSEDCCYIGIITKTTAQTFSLYEIDPRAQWEKEYRYYYRKISKLEWGGGYENALWQVGKKDMPQELAVRK